MNLSIAMVPANAGVALVPADAGVALVPADAGVALVPAEAGVARIPAEAGASSASPAHAPAPTVATDAPHASGVTGAERPSQSPEQLFPLLYEDLRRLARSHLRRHAERFVTLGATTLLHEAYLRLKHIAPMPSFATDGHFLAYVTRAMRSMVVDHARRRMRHKRGASSEFVTLDTDLCENLSEPIHVVRIDEHLHDLRALSPDLADVVELRFFCGLSLIEIAESRGCSERTVQRDWEKARRLLTAMIRGEVIATRG